MKDSAPSLPTMVVFLKSAAGRASPTPPLSLALQPKAGLTSSPTHHSQWSCSLPPDEKVEETGAPQRLGREEGRVLGVATLLPSCTPHPTVPALSRALCSSSLPPSLAASLHTLSCCLQRVHPGPRAPQRLRREEGRVLRDCHSPSLLYSPPLSPPCPVPWKPDTPETAVHPSPPTLHTQERSSPRMAHKGSLQVRPHISDSQKDVPYNTYNK